MKVKSLIWLFVVATTAVIVINVIFNSTGNAFSFSWFSSIGDKKVEAQSAVSIPMYGNDGRGYPFNFEDRRCLAVATTEGVGVTCWKK